jgi:hypothetical protein
VGPCKLVPELLTSSQLSMKKLLLLLAFLIPFCLTAKDEAESFPTKQDTAILAESLFLESEEILFLGRGNFNSVTGVRFGKGRPFTGFTGYVAATNNNLYLILGSRLKPRRDDVLVVPFAEIYGVSHIDDQVQLKCEDFFVIAEFKGSISKAQHTNLSQLLTNRGVASWNPEGFYNLTGTKSSALPHSRPSIFPPSKMDERRARSAGLTVPVYPKTSHCTHYDPKGEYYTKSD